MVNVVFKLTDSHGNRLYTSVEVSPSISPINYNGSVVCGNTIKVNTKGLASTSIDLIPNTYHVRLSGYNANTQFNMLLPSSIEGQTVKAKDYITND